MIGRMNREANPNPGEKAGFTPQYKDNDGNFVDVTPLTPYPVADSSTIYILSTEPKPTEGVPKGKTLFEMDTTDAYIFDGTIWRLI